MRVAKLIAEIGADIASFRAAAREASRELEGLIKKQESLGKSAVTQNERVRASEQRLLNVSHQIIAATLNEQNAKRNLEKQELQLANTKRRKLATEKLIESGAKNQAVLAERLINLTHNQKIQELQLDNAKNTHLKSVHALNRAIRVSTTETLKNAEAIKAQEIIAEKAAATIIEAEAAKRRAISANNAKTKQELEVERQLRRKNEIEYTAWWTKQLTLQDADIARKQKAKKELEVERQLRRKNEIEYTAWWTRQLDLQDAQIAKTNKLNLKEQELAKSRAYQVSLLGKLSGAYTGLHKAQTFFTQSATALTATITLPFALVAKSAFDASVKMESFQVAIENVVGSSEKAKSELHDLQKMAIAPGLELEALARAFPRILKFTESTDEAKEVLAQFGNELGRQKASVDEIRRTFENIPQIMSMKTLVGQETMQMSRLLVDFRSALIRKFGTAEGKELAAQGLSGKDVIMGLTEEFAKAGRAIDSTQNKVKNLNQEFFILKAEIGNEFKAIFIELAPIMSQTMREAVTWFRALSPEIKRNIIVGAGFLAVAGPIAIAISGIIGVIRAGIGTVFAFGKAFSLLFPASTVTQIITGMNTVAVTATATGTTTATAGAVASAGWLGVVAVLGQVILIAGASAVAVIALQKAWETAVSWGLKTTEQIEAEIRAESQRIKTKAEVANKVAILSKEYERLRDNVNNLNKNQLERMNSLFDQIAKLSPELVQGYDAQGNAIHGLKQKYDDLRVAADRATEAQRINAFTSTYKPQLSSLVDRLTRARDAKEKILKDGIWSGAKSGPEFNKAMGFLNSEISSLEKQMAELNQTMRDASNRSKGFATGFNGSAVSLNPSYDDYFSSTKPSSGNSGSSSSTRNAKLIKEVAGFTEAQLEAMAKYINTPAGENSCAYFASQMIEKMYGVDVPDWSGKAGMGIGRAGNGNGLEDWIKAKGGVQIGRNKAKAGDIVFMPGNGPSGVHVGIFDGRNIIDSSGKPSSFGDRSKVRFDRGISGSSRFYRAPWDQEDGAQAIKSLRDQETTIERINRLLAEQTEKILQKNLEVRQQINDLHRQEKLANLSGRNRRVIEAFGIDKWYDPQIDQSKKDSFANIFNRMFDKAQLKDASKSLVELNIEVKSFYDEVFGKGQKTKSQEVESSIERIISGIENKAKLANPWVQLMIANIRALAKAADVEALRKLSEEINAPFNRNISEVNSRLSGTFSPRDSALRDFMDSNKDNFAKLDDKGASNIRKFLESYDLTRSAENVFRYREQIGYLNLEYQRLTSSSQFDIWLSRQKVWNEELQKFELPDGMKDPKNAREIYNAQRKNQNLEQYNRLLGDMTVQMAELSANSPFERWRVSLAQLNEAGGLTPLVADVKQLEIIFANNQLMELLTEFADGARGIFSDLIYDISEKGFKGMFANIYAGFQQLLFKMAVEYLASILYQSLLGSLGSLFSVGAGIGGGGGKKGGLGIVNSLVPSSGGGGSLGPNIGGDIFNSSISRSIENIGGSNSLARYASSEYSTAVNYGDSSSIINEGSSKSSNSQVIIINNYYGTVPRDAQKRTTTQIAIEGQRQADRIVQRLG